MKLNRAFSLVELMVALGIFAILAALVTLNSTRARNKAKNTAILSAARTVALDHVAPNMANFPQNRRWGGSRKTNFLNGYLNQALRRPGRTNVYNYKNPVSGSERIRLGGSPGNPAAAILLTNRRRFRYENLATRSRLLKRSAGLIIVWMSRRDPAVEVFYVDTSGKLSDFHWVN